MLLLRHFFYAILMEQWYNELPEWREDAQSVGHPSTSSRFIRILRLCRESDKKEFEDQFVRTFDFSQNTIDVFIDL